MPLASTLKKVNFALTLGVVLLLPIFFLPLTPEFYDFNKHALLLLVSGVSLILWTASFVLEKQVRVTRSPLGLPLLFLALTWAVSAFLYSPNRLDSLLEPGRAGTIIALVVFFFTAVNSLSSRQQLDALINTFIFSIALLGLISVLWSSGLAPTLFPTGAFLKNPLWTTTGNSFSTLTLLALSLPFLILLLIKAQTEITRSRIALILVTLILAIAGSGLLAYRLFFQPNTPNRPVFLSQPVSWVIAMESLKNSPLLGTGPGTYLSDFTRFRPISYNLSPTWAVRFASSSNFYLQLLATTGLLGLIAYLFVVLRTFRLFSRSLKTSPDSSLHSTAIAASSTALTAFLLQFFLPASLTQLSFVIFLLIIAVTAFKFLGSSLVHDANIDIVAASDSGSRSPLLPWISLSLALILTLPAFYFASRYYAAEILYRQALVAATSNQGKLTYDTLINAIRTYPYRDTYRVSYSQTNLLLANSLASDKTELTPDERNTITQLIQQSIREAKNAVALNPTKVSNVENLAAVYKSLLNLARGADSWTIASYRQAINLDPTNPNLRIALGGVFYGLKNYDDAIRLFQSAIDLKPDHANAYYNLSAALREKDDPQRAALAMQTVVNLLPKDSADYTKALTELEQLRQKAGETTSAPTRPTEPAQTQLQEPPPLPTPIISPPLELPADAGPETTPPAPSPTPAATPSPTL